MIPERSEDGKYARSIFFEEYNDIDIFVEDGAYGYRKIYVNIMARVFHGRYRIADVFPLGDRNSVINRCRMVAGKVNRPTLFIVDGDLYMLSGEALLDGMGLYVLPFYSIENVLLDINAIYEIICEEDPEKKACKAVDEFGFENWVEKNMSLLFDLFVEYALIFKFLPHVETVSYPLRKIISSCEGDVCEKKVLKRACELKGMLIDSIGVKTYQEARAVVVSSVRGDIMRYISAKDYLFPLIRMKMKKVSRTNASDINLKVRLSKICDVQCIDGLNECVVSS